MASNHLLFNRITITPTNAEFVSIYNPTSSDIDLSNYYITDSVIDENLYYNLPTGANFWSESIGSTTTDFIAQFPSISVASNDSIVLSFHTSDLFESYYGYQPDISLMEDMLDLNDSGTISCNWSPDCPDNSNLLHDNSEVLILFHWDQESDTVEDVDYFLWGSNNHAIDKSGVGSYQNDTSIAEQDFIYNHENDSTYIRIDLYEGEESQNGSGNGIFGDDETSEDLSSTWTVSKAPEFGCTNSEAANYNSNAILDDGSCLVALTIPDIINNCSYETNETIGCSSNYELSSASASECPMYEEIITTEGVIVDYFDITIFNGPHSFTLEDENGYRVDFVAWPEDIDFSNHKFTQAPFGLYKVQITGELGVHCDDDQTLDISSEWQITVSNESDIILLEEYNYEGYFTEGYHKKVKISPEPYVIIPSLGETLDFTYSHPSNSRILIRIFDLSGRFVTSIIDKYVENSGTWSNGFNPEDQSESSNSSWDGRDHLGQIISPGTYLIHIEAYDFSTGMTYKDMAPIVVGVNK